MSISIKRLVPGRFQSDLAEYFLARRFTFPPELRDAGKLSAALGVIRARWPEVQSVTDDPEQPIFLFSAGWRSGSTLMQRILMSSGEVMVWGEPLGDAAFVARLGHAMSCFTESWPPDHFITPSADASGLSAEWIANLTPEIGFLHRAQRAFILEWMKQSANETYHCSKWGFKEVRLTIDHARYLKWLFPGARFLFICRNPFDAYRSWKGNRWRSPWPGYYRNSALAFARHWKLLAEGFVAGVDSVDGMLVRYEDLIAGKLDLAVIAEHVGVTQLDASVLEARVDRPKGQKVNRKKPITWIDRAIINSVCGELLMTLRYKPGR